MITHLLPGRCEWICEPFICSLDLDLGRPRLVLEATLCVGPCIEAAYDARDILSDCAANDWRDWRNSEINLCYLRFKTKLWKKLPGLELTKLLGNAEFRYPRCELFEKLWCDWPSARDLQKKINHLCTM